MKGRKLISISEKKTKGTLRANRENADPVALDINLPRAPEWLDKKACEIFGRIATRLETENRASKSHTEIIAIIATRLSEVERLTEIIEEEGFIYETSKFTKDEKGVLHETVLKKSHPAFQQRSDAQRHAHSLLAELYLTPATYSKASPYKREQQNPFGKKMHGGT